ncbi:MAG: ATP synthase F1 subunit epsilon [Bryobacteraceae bacterium]|nr:ATP synthase F1 subunit epsilon [Bryobacteraceae bacterium]
MAGLLELEVATPERYLLKEKVVAVDVPAANGMLGILPEHAPLISELGCGSLKFSTETGQSRVLSICGGYVEVASNHVRVLAARAEYADEIDVKRAEEALKRANERLLHPTPGVDMARALSAMQRAQARLAAAKAAAH